MTREEMVDLTEFIGAICPQQKIRRETAIPWYEVIGHLSFEEARSAVIAIKHAKAFVDPSDILAEVRRSRSSHPSDRTVSEALGSSNRREIGVAPSVPPNAEYTAALKSMQARMRERDEKAYLASRATTRRADDWIAYKLNGKLPPPPPAGTAPGPRWVPLPGDPPELQQWLVRRNAAEHPERALPPDWPQEPPGE